MSPGGDGLEADTVRVVFSYFRHRLLLSLHGVSDILTATRIYSHFRLGCFIAPGCSAWSRVFALMRM